MRKEKNTDSKISRYKCMGPKMSMSMAIEDGKQTWSEVSQNTIAKCFKKTKMYSQEVEDDSGKVKMSYLPCKS